MGGRSLAVRRRRRAEGCTRRRRHAATRPALAAGRERVAARRWALARHHRLGHPVGDRRHGAQVGEDRVQVLVRQLAVGLPGHRRQDRPRQAPMAATAQGRLEDLLGPDADAGRLVRGQVGGRS